MFWKKKNIETEKFDPHRSQERFEVNRPLSIRRISTCRSEELQKLEWVDEFISNVKAYIFVRTEDNMLIKRPNQATKINESAAQILQFLLNGGKTADLIKKVGEDKIPEIQNFMLALKQNLEGNLDEFSLNPAVEKKRFDLGFSKLPVLSELALTYKCNLKCQFCYAGCNCTTNPTGSNQELGLDEFKEIITTIYTKAKVPSISFTGGEPTLRRDVLIACIKYAKELGMRVNLITNGTLINENYAKGLVEAGLDSVQVSIEGTTAETHGLLVMQKGAFEKSIAAVKIFKNLGIHVHTNTTLNKKNAEDCKLLPQFVHSLGIDRFSMNLVIPTGSSVFNDGLVIKYSEVGKIIQEIQQKSKENEIEFMWYSPLPLCMFNTITHDLGNKGCAACDGLLSVAPNGDVLPCSSYDQSVGNLVDSDFSEVWEGKNAVYFREKRFAHDLCNSCDSLAACNGACPLYWRSLGYQELYNTLEVKIL